MLENYYSPNDRGVSFTRQQASKFAKHVANDFNPIHDPESKRFCVPGDLLFAVSLEKYGLSEHMSFAFSGMVGDGVELLFPETDARKIDILDKNGKKYLHFEREGATTRDAGRIYELIYQYVRFSGHNFPHILVPLMAKHNVMINPDRPLVIYEGMDIRLDTLDFAKPELSLADSKLDVQGRRGNVTLEFDISADGAAVGHGKKTMVLSGLKPYDAEKIQNLIDAYEERKRTLGKA